MKLSAIQEPPARTNGSTEQKISKKDQILALHASGISEVEDLALREGVVVTDHFKATAPHLLKHGKP